MTDSINPSLVILVCCPYFMTIANRMIQSNLSYVTFQGNSEIWSLKTGGHLKQVYLI
jgi:hypothetical protein